MEKGGEMTMCLFMKSKWILGLGLPWEKEDSKQVTSKSINPEWGTIPPANPQTRSMKTTT